MLEISKGKRGYLHPLFKLLDEIDCFVYYSKEDKIIFVEYGNGKQVLSFDPRFIIDDIRQYINTK